MSNPLVKVISMGGTIAMAQSDQGGVVPSLSGEMLVAAVPALTQIAQIHSLSFRQTPGAHLQYGDLEALAETIKDASTAGYRGIVVTQGTDTIEETAFALDCLLQLDMPIVVTGAMRNPTLAGADGPANLLAAVQAAASDEARGLGCLVIMNDEIHAARFARKIHTSSPAAFSSPLVGQIGWVSEGQVRIAVQPQRMPAIQYVGSKGDKRVALVTVALGDDGTLINALLQDRLFEGIVVEATGGGHVPPGVAAALEDAAKTMPVVLTSRTGTGEVLSRTYGFPGGEIDLQRRGLIRAGWLDGIKAKVLLTLLLRHGHNDISAIAQAFQPWGGGTLLAGMALA